MKTQLTKPSRTKARYTEEYKQEALELWRASGRSAAKVAAELGIRPPLLYRWASLERGPNGPKAETDPVFWKSVRIGIKNCRDVEQPLLIVALPDHRATDAMTKAAYIRLIVASYTSKHKHQ